MAVTRNPKPVSGIKNATKPDRPKAPVIKINTNPKPLNESQKLEANFNSWAKSQPSAQKNTVKETIKINSNPVKTSGLQGREVGNMDHQGGHGLSGGSTGGNSSGVNIKYSK